MGFPSICPPQLRVEKLVKKARKAKLLSTAKPTRRSSKSAVARELFELAAYARARGWTAEELLMAKPRSGSNGYETKSGAGCGPLTLPRIHFARICPA